MPYFASAIAMTKKNKQYKIGEIIVSESEWTPPSAKCPDGVLVTLKIGIKETILQDNQEEAAA